MGTEDRKGTEGKTKKNRIIFGTINKHEAGARILAGETASTRQPMVRKKRDENIARPLAKTQQMAGTQGYPNIFGTMNKEKREAPV